MLERVHIVSLNSLGRQWLLILINSPKNGKSWISGLQNPFIGPINDSSVYDESDTDILCWTWSYAFWCLLNMLMPPGASATQWMKRYLRINIGSHLYEIGQWFSHRISNLQLFATSEGKFFIFRPKDWSGKKYVHASGMQEFLSFLY